VFIGSFFGIFGPSAAAALVRRIVVAKAQAYTAVSTIPSSGLAFGQPLKSNVERQLSSKLNGNIGSGRDEQPS